MTRSILSAALALAFVTVMLQAQMPGTIVATNAVWKYLETPTTPSGDWTQRAYNDGTWQSGAAQLGYGEGDEASVIGFGPDPNNKYITTYFRRKFTVTDPAAYLSLIFELTFDDGAVVYLNGSELYRVSMPEGPVSWNTLALTQADYANDIRSFSPTVLVPGENVLAVEVHQGFAGSSDLSFALAIRGRMPPMISITSPPADTVLAPPVDLALDADASDPDGTVTLVQFYDGDTFLGYASSAPFSITVSNLAADSHVLTATATDNEGLMSTSGPVVITVNDPNPPALVMAVALGSMVEVHFSKAVMQPSATALENYTISPSVTILSAHYGGASNVIKLSTSGFVFGATYTLTANDVRDRTGNVIAPNSEISFQAGAFTSGDIGFPLISGSSVAVPDGYDVTGAGTDIGGTSDQFHFHYERTARLGDFDLRVRATSFTSSDTWAKAALMAREDLQASNRFAAAVATPSLGGSFFSYRLVAGGPGANAGAAPATFPDMWLRLKREGNTLTGFMSADGSSWTILGSITLPGLAPALYVGMAVTSHKPTETATAQFRQFSPVTGGTIGSLRLAREPLGPASRRTGLVISEIFYGELACCVDDDATDGGPRHCYPGEFIEIYNSNPFFENLGDLQLAGNIIYRFPEGTTIPGGGFLVLTQGQYSGSLTLCEGVRLLDKGGAILAEVTYTNRPPWPLADGTGHSIVLSRPSYGQNNPKAWSLSDASGGSPGAAEPLVTRVGDSLRINEVISPWQMETQSLLELYNHSNEAIDMSHYVISGLGSEWLVTEGTTIPARGFRYVVLTIRAQTGSLYLINPDRNHIVDAVWYQRRAGSDYYGRYPDGADEFYPLSGGLLESNRPPLRSQVVINEIMYAPVTGRDDDEYVELYNRGPDAADVSGWSLSTSIHYTNPPGTIIGSSNYLLIAKSPDRMLARYPHLSSANVVGGFAGDLDDNGERIVLSNAGGEVVDEVTYGIGGEWGEWSRGGGSSLELKDPDSDGRYAHNWADSDETSKGVWTTIERTASIGETLAFDPASPSLHIFLLGAGECLVDEIEVRNNHGAGINLLNVNPGFEAGLTGWALQGSHDHSALAQEGFASSRSLHVRAATVGDNGPNRVRSSILSAAPTGDVLLRVRAKWLRGSPEIALRVHGGGWEASGRMEIQPNGTPGLRNSRAVPNAGPAIFNVSHDPPLPAANENVRITASVSDPDGLHLLMVQFRIDSGPYEPAGMADDGTGSDEIAGDGIYTAAIVGHPAGVRLGFYIEAIDTLGATNTFPQSVFPTPPYDRVFPTDAHNRECVVRWGEMNVPGAFGTYHLWLNSENTARWANRMPRLNDTPLDATFVYNNSRVIYNVRPAYHSSPWHRALRTTGPDGNQAIDYGVNFPPDDPFLGATEALWIHPGNLNSGSTIDSTDDTAQAESAANTILKAFGLQGNYQRYVHVFVNGSRRSMMRANPFIMQDAQRPNVDTMRQWSSADRGGDLLWLEDWYEYPNNGDDFLANNDADLTRREVMLFPNGKAFHMGAYRFMFRPSDTRPGKSANDYSTLFALLNTVTPANDAPVHLPAIEAVLDYRQWMRMLAAQHAFGNWDTYGYDRGRNAYLYRSSTGPVQLWAWKNNFTLGVGSHSFNTDLFGTTDPRVTQMWREPAILRAYWQAFFDLINGPFQSAYMHPIIDARVAALRANGVVVQEGSVATVKSFIDARRNYLAGRLAGATNVPLTAVALGTNSNLLTLRGAAPIQVAHVSINGILYPLVWSMAPTMSTPYPVPTNWTATVVLVPGPNNFTIAGYDANYRLVTPIITLHAEYNGPGADPRDNVIFTEIMFRPAQPGTEYVELFNKSPNLGFNLNDWTVNGLDFGFPPGTVLGPNQFIVLAKSPFSLNSAFPDVSGVYAFPGALDPSGETLSLLLPYQQGVIDRVHYDTTPPWPQNANGRGSSLQVIDMNEDNSRVSNWTDGFGWRYATFTGTIRNNGTNFVIFLKSAGSVYVDDIVLVRGTVPEAGPNILQNGDFESPLDGTWTASGNHSNSVRSIDVRHNGNASLKVISTSAGSPNNYVNQLIPANPSDDVFTLSYWFLPSTNASTLSLRTTPGSEFISLTDITPEWATPGRSNSFSMDLPSYDPIWLNEILLENGDPWFEIYNRGTNAISLTEYYFAGLAGPDEYSLAGQPDVAPREFRVVPLPGLPGLGSYALWRKIGTHNQLVDYLRADSPIYGAVPDGQPFERGPLRYPTRALSNLSPRVKSIERYPGITYLQFQVTPGEYYYVEYKDELSAPGSWLSFGGDYLFASGPEIQFADTHPSLTGRRFYRLTAVFGVP